MSKKASINQIAAANVQEPNADGEAVLEIKAKSWALAVEAGICNVSVKCIGSCVS